ncbi:MAG: hypothetical protein R3C69_16110 [Geminicoccaceae bacterium]
MASLARADADALGHLADHVVARPGPESLVDAAETVDVDDQQHRLLVPVAAMAQARREQPHAADAVQEPRQLVVPIDEAEPLARLDDVADVHGDPAKPDE